MEGFLNYEGAKLLSEEIKSRLKAVTEMPEKAEENRAVLYIGETTGQYVKGHIYQSEKSAEYYALEATIENAGTLYFYLKSLAVGAKPIYQSAMLVDPEDSSKGALPVQNVIAGENCQDVTEYMDVTEISPNGDVTLTPKGGAGLVFHRRPDLDLGAATAWGDITPVNGETAPGLNQGLTAVTEMPAEAENGSLALYVGDSANGYTKGHIYQYSEGETYYAFKLEHPDFNVYVYLTKIAVGTKPIYTAGGPTESVSDLTDISEELNITEVLSDGNLTVTQSNGETFRLIRQVDSDFGGSSWTDLAPAGQNLKTVLEMPAEAENGETAMYIGESTDPYVKGHIYRYEENIYHEYEATDNGFTYRVYVKNPGPGATMYYKDPEDNGTPLAASSSELTHVFTEPSMAITRVLSTGDIMIKGGIAFVWHPENDLNEGAEWVDLTPNSSEPEFGYIGNEVETKVSEGWTTTFQNGSESKQITLSQDGWYYINSRIWQNERKDSNTIVFANTLDEDQPHTLFRHGYSQAGESVQSAMLPLKAGTYSVSHSASANNVDGYAEFYINRWSVAK